MIITIDIDEQTINEINSIYGDNRYDIVETVVQDILKRYLSAEYFDSELQIEKGENISLDSFILSEIKKTIYQIITNNGFDKSLFDSKLFNKAIERGFLVIKESEIARIYALAEVYYKIANKPTCYGEIIELIASYDAQTYK